MRIENAFHKTASTLYKPEMNLTKSHASIGVNEWWYKCKSVICDFFFRSTKKMVSANSVNFDK